MNQTTIETTPYVFVYGTLKVGGRLSHPFDEVREAVIKGTAVGKMWSVMGSYPAVKFDEPGIIHGELHLYHEFAQVVAHLDHIEGYSGERNSHNLYNREIIDVQTKAGIVKAFAYEWNGETDDMEEVTDGNWKN